MEHGEMTGPAADVAGLIRKRALARAETVRELLPEYRARAVSAAGIEDTRVLERIREACASVPEGEDWREARKRKKNGKLGNARKPKKLLVSSGTLRKSFYVEDSGADSFSIATPVRYAKYHEYGTQKMPSRPVMPIDPVLGKPRGEKVERAIREAVEARVKLALGMK